LHIEYETINRSHEILGLTLEQARERLEQLRKEVLQNPSESNHKKLRLYQSHKRGGWTLEHIT